MGNVKSLMFASKFPTTDDVAHNLTLLRKLLICKQTHSRARSHILAYMQNHSHTYAYLHTHTHHIETHAHTCTRTRNTHIYLYTHKYRHSIFT